MKGEKKKNPQILIPLTFCKSSTVEAVPSSYKTPCPPHLVLLRQLFLVDCL